MPLQGSLVIVADRPTELARALGAAGGFAIIETHVANAPAAIEAAKPAAIILADTDAAIDVRLAKMLTEKVTAAAPIIPVLARLPLDGALAYREALPVALDAPVSVLTARLSAALRVRTLHGTVLRRAEAAKTDGRPLPPASSNDPLDDATVIVAGRARSYPALAVAIGERVGLIGALSIETAAQYLKARDVDGLVVGDGFSLRNLRALLTVLAEDTTFRDLPIAILDGGEAALDYDLPGLVQNSDPTLLVAHVMPYVRLHAFEMRLKRILASLDADGILDPDTGLLHADAFARDLEGALRGAGERGTGLSIARLVFEPHLAPRASADAARLVSRLVRQVDFGCREEDGSVLIVFTETDLQHAQVIARRIAGALKDTMLQLDRQQPMAPAVTLATLKASDTVTSLLARVSAPAIAAE
jgi:hypothetical protein